VCMVCLRRIDKRSEQLEKRVEYRGVVHQDRFRTRKLGDICKACALDEMGEGASQPKQGTLA
jgi:hypothetical protein